MKHVGMRVLAIMAALLLLFALCACNAEEQSGDGGAYYVTYKDTKICPGEDAKGLLDAIGAPLSEKSNGNCGGQGEQMKYSYSSFDLYLLETVDGKVTVDQISLKDDLISTPEGISIGSSKSEVLDAYGDPSETTAKTLIYRKGKQVLTFKLDGDSVSAIDLMHVTQ